MPRFTKLPIATTKANVQTSTKMTAGYLAAALFTLGLTTGLVGCKHNTEKSPSSSESTAPANTSSTSTKPTQNTTSNGEPVSLKSDNSALAFVQSNIVHAEQLPVLSDLPASFAYDETKTVRFYPPITGRVTQILVQPGQMVHKGQVLATIDSPDFSNISSDVAAAQQDLHFKQQTLARNKLLLEGGAIPKKDVEASENDLALAQINLGRTQAKLKNVSQGANGNGLQALRAPIEGTIAEMNINPGQELQTLNAPLFVISDLSHLWVNAAIDDTKASLIRQGETVQVRVPVLGDDARYSATVTQVASALDSSSHRLTLHAKLNSSDNRIKPQMLAQIDVINKLAAPSVAVRNTAIVTEGVNNYVLIDLGNNKYRKQLVTIGHQDTDTSYITKGLNDGDKVVTQGALLLNAQLNGAG